MGAPANRVDPVQPPQKPDTVPQSEGEPTPPKELPPGIEPAPKTVPNGHLHPYYEGEPGFRLVGAEPIEPEQVKQQSESGAASSPIVSGVYMDDGGGGVGFGLAVLLLIGAAAKAL